MTQEQFVHDQIAQKIATIASSDIAEDSNGLTEAEAEKRLAQYGENALAEHHVSVIERLAHFFLGADSLDDRSGGDAFCRTRTLGGSLDYSPPCFSSTQVSDSLAGIQGPTMQLLCSNSDSPLKARVHRDGTWKRHRGKISRAGRCCPCESSAIFVPADLRLIDGRLPERRPSGPDRRITSGRTRRLVTTSILGRSHGKAR